MDTKSKSSKAIGIVLSILLVLGLAVGAVGTYPSISDQLKMQQSPVYNSEWFEDELTDFIYGTYYFTKSNGQTLTPSEVFLPEFTQETFQYEQEYRKLVRDAALSGNISSELLADLSNQNFYITEQGARNLPSDEVQNVPSQEFPVREPDAQQDNTISIENATDDAGKPLVLTQDDLVQGGLDLVERSKILSEFDSDFFYSSSRVNEAVFNPHNIIFSVQTDGGTAITNDKSGVISGLLSSADPRLSLPEAYQFLIRVQFDKNGNFTIRDLLTEDPQYAQGHRVTIENTIRNYPFRMLNTHGVPSRFGTSPLKKYAFNESSFLNAQSILPRGITAVFAIPREIVAGDLVADIAFSSLQANLGRTLFPLVFIAVLGIGALAGLVFGLFRFWNLGSGRLLRNIPVELLLAADITLAMAGYKILILLLIPTLNGSFSLFLTKNMLLSPAAAQALTIAANFAVWIVFAATAYVSLLSYAKIFRIGPAAYLTERSWCVQILLWLWRIIRTFCQKIWTSVFDIRLEASAHSTILKLVALHTVICTGICLLWVYALPLVAVYSIFLYLVLKKKYIAFQSDYQNIQNAVSQMSEGNLDFQMEENAGVFEPLRAELCEVRSGFKKAVDQEVKSQNMKTELITNVSHDLKTPLTAIITYIDLLKDETISDEQRREYISTLDHKSQRLKQLISDLFEVSKASSQNVTLDLERLDLCALLKQVRYELGDKIQESGLDFRWDIPQEKVFVMLDGNRTCRIFENLIINITKYSLPGTRAYISLAASDRTVRAVFRNISAAELPADAQKLTERFVRGDESRNTEGNGLGLAIVKSFVELQHGTLRISVDGDLFKAEVEWALAPDCEPESPAAADDLQQSVDSNALPAVPSTEPESTF